MLTEIESCFQATSCGVVRTLTEYLSVFVTVTSEFVLFVAVSDRQGPINEKKTLLLGTFSAGEGLRWLSVGGVSGPMRDLTRPIELC